MRGKDRKGFPRCTNEISFGRKKSHQDAKKIEQVFTHWKSSGVKEGKATLTTLM